MPSSMSSTSMREIDGRDRSSSSPSGVAATTLAEPLTQHDARPDLEDGDSGNESSGGPLVVANGEDLHFFAENPVDIHGTSRILKAFHFASIRSALERRYQLDDWHCLYNLQVWHLLNCFFVCAVHLWFCLSRRLLTEFTSTRLRLLLCCLISFMFPAAAWRQYHSVSEARQRARADCAGDGGFLGIRVGGFHFCSMDRPQRLVWEW